MNGEDIKQLRKTLKLTQAELASKLGVSVTTIARWEGKKARPSQLAKRQLARLQRRGR